MAQQIECDKLLVKDLFSKWFRIPEYQRPYMWDKEQVIELLDDITQARALSPSSQYFLGSMVLRKNSKKEIDTKTEYEEYDVLDGQQRLTTLFLITAVVRDMTPKTNTSRLKSCHETIYQMANPDDNIPERLRIVFDTREQVKDFINEFVKEDNGTANESELLSVANNKENISICNMAKAILNIREYFKTTNIDDFFPYLRSNVLMIYVSAEGLEDAFRLFTVMNNRGVKLRNSDILKADNLKAIQDNVKRLEYAEKWETAENYFGEDFDIFLSHLRTILVKRKASAHLLKEFEENIYAPTSYNSSTKTKSPVTPLLKKGVDTLDFINKYKKHYEDLFDNTGKLSINGSYELHNYLYLMKTGFEADFWVAPLLRFYDKFKTDKLIDFVKALDNKFAHDWLIGDTLAKRIEQVNAIIQAIDDAKISNDVLKSTCLILGNKPKLADVLDSNIYGSGKPTRARYILFKLELLYRAPTQQLNFPDETISIEHILPQNPRDGSQWTRDFDKSQREAWTDKLGNLLLMSRRKNSAQGNLDYAEKKTKYFDGYIELFASTTRVFNLYPTTWSLADLTKNHAEVLATIKQGFGIP